MKKILEMFGEPISYGGQESVVYNMLSVFDLKNEFNIDLYTPYYADNKELIDLVNTNNGNIFISNMPFKTNDNRFKLYNTVDSFFRLHNNYDVVHIHTGSLTTMFVYAKLAKKHCIKKVIVHSHIANYNQNIFFKIRRLMLCLGLKKYADVYMGCSLKAIDAKFKPISCKPILVNNGIDISKFLFNIDARNKIRDEYNINDKFVIGNVGRFNDKQKNYKFMIDVISKIENNNFVLMLVGDGEDLQKIKKYAILNKVYDKVIFAGNKNDAYKYYMAFDVFIMPSRFEGLGITAVEAQLSGLPVLISNQIPFQVKISKTTIFLNINYIDIWIKEIMKLFDSNATINRNKIKLDIKKYDRNETYRVVKNIYEE